MDVKKWAAVERFLTGELVGSDEALDAAIEASSASGLPPINITASEGKLLWILARSVKARSILEIGTLGGYSTIWLARALQPGGSLITLEIDAKHAKVARKNIARAGLSNIEVRLGPALESLPRLVSEGAGPFDLTFIDADKENYAEYFAWALNLSRPGSLIVVDNVVRDGEVLNSRSKDPAVLGHRRLLEFIGSEMRVSATAIPTVSSKGYDGFAVALVTGD